MKFKKNIMANPNFDNVQSMNSPRNFHLQIPDVTATCKKKARGAKERKGKKTDEEQRRYFQEASDAFFSSFTLDKLFDFVT